MSYLYFKRLFEMSINGVTDLRFDNSRFSDDISFPLKKMKQQKRKLVYEMYTKTLDLERSKLRIFLFYFNEKQ